MTHIIPFRRGRVAPLWRQRSRRIAHPRHRVNRPFGFIALAAMMGLALLTLRDGASDTTPDRGTADIRIGGYASAVDGDTLRINGERIRLIGIDAPELRQTCRDANGQPWSCGRAATRRLSALASGNVACTAHSRDRYHRPLARCAAAGIGDLGEVLVREGHAVGYYGGYRQAEAEARAARRGLWSGTFERPEAWRRQHRRQH